MGTWLLHADNSGEVEAGVSIQCAVQGPGIVNRLLIFTGTAILGTTASQGTPGEGFAGPQGTPGQANDFKLEIILMHPFDFQLPTGVQSTATYAAIASEGSDAAEQECFLDISPDVTTAVEDRALKLIANIRVGTGSHFYRIAYQANVLAHAE